MIFLLFFYFFGLVVFTFFLLFCFRCLNVQLRRSAFANPIEAGKHLEDWRVCQRMDKLEANKAFVNLLFGQFVIVANLFLGKELRRHCNFIIFAFGLVLQLALIFEENFGRWHLLFDADGTSRRLQRIVLPLLIHMIHGVVCIQALLDPVKCATILVLAS